MGWTPVKAPLYPKGLLKAVRRVYSIMYKEVVLKVVPGPILVCSDTQPRSYISYVPTKSGRTHKVAAIPTSTSEGSTETFQATRS